MKRKNLILLPATLVAASMMLAGCGEAASSAGAEVSVEASTEEVDVASDAEARVPKDWIALILQVVMRVQRLFPVNLLLLTMQQQLFRFLNLAAQRKKNSGYLSRSAEFGRQTISRRIFMCLMEKK